MTVTAVKESRRANARRVGREEEIFEDALFCFAYYEDYGEARAFAPSRMVL
jgi:hypothetical protein